MRSRRRLLLAVVPAVLLALVLPTVRSSAEERAADRLLVFSIPHVGWEEITPGAAPNLRAFLDDAAVANLATRVTSRTTRLGEGYATMGAGTRAVAPGETASLAFMADEPFGIDTAAETYERRLGAPLEGVAGLLSFPELEGANDSSHFGAEVGGIGEALAEAGVGRAVVGNADLPPTQPDQLTWHRHREAVTALMDVQGAMPGGRVDDALLVDDPEAAAGVRLDEGQVLDTFRRSWTDRAVVLVEASDLPRAHAVRPNTTGEQSDRLFARALAGADELFGTLLDEVDPERDAVMVVSPATPDTPGLTVFGYRGPGTEVGLLESGQTRRAGFVTMADVGPTILELVGVEPPEGLEGRPAVVAATGGSAQERYDSMVSVDEAARFRDSLVWEVTQAYVVLHILVVAVGAIGLRRHRVRSAAVMAGFVLLALLPLTYLAGAGDFASLGSAAYLVGLTAGALLLGAGAFLLRRRGLVAPSLLLVLDLIVISVSVVAMGSMLQFNTVFGDSPVVAGRFAGVNNLTFAQLMVAAIVLAAFVAHRWPGRRGKVAAVALLGAVLLVDGLPMWGADVGGVLTGVPAFAVTASALLGLRVRWRSAIAWALATILAVVGLGLLDLTRAANERTHLGRLFEQIGADGMEGFWLVIERKLAQNLRALTEQWWLWLVLASLAALAYMMWRHRDSWQGLCDELPEVRAAAFGVGVGAVLGFALNDSGIAVPGMMLAVFNPVLLHLLFCYRAQHGDGDVRNVGDETVDSEIREPSDLVGVVDGPGVHSEPR